MAGSGSFFLEVGLSRVMVANYWEANRSAGCVLPPNQKQNKATESTLEQSVW